MGLFEAAPLSGFGLVERVSCVGGVAIARVCTPRHVVSPRASAVHPFGSASSARRAHLLTGGADLGIERRGHEPSRRHRRSTGVTRSLDRGIPKGGVSTHHPGSSEVVGELGFPRELESCYRHARNAERQGQDVPDSRGKYPQSSNIAGRPASRASNSRSVSTAVSWSPALRSEPLLVARFLDRISARAPPPR